MQIVGIWPYSVRQMSRARLTLEEFRDVGDGGDGRRDEEMASGELAIRFLPSSFSFTHRCQHVGTKRKDTSWRAHGHPGDLKTRAGSVWSRGRWLLLPCRERRVRGGFCRSG